MTQIKGAAIRGVLAYVKHLDPEGGIERVLARIEGEPRATFARRILSGSWYPYPAYAALLAATDDTFGRGDLATMRAFGRWAVERDAGTLLKVLSLFTSVESLIQRGFAFWGTVFWGRICDAGWIDVTATGPGSGALTIYDFPDVAPAHCQLNVGYLEGLCRTVGARDVEVEKTACVHAGDEVCAYRASWS